MAGKFSSFNKDGSLTETAQDVLDTVSALSGKKSTVHLTPEESWGTGLGGYVKFETPKKIYLDPENGNVHVLAHEAIHSQLGTDVGASQMRNRMKGGNDFDMDIDMNPMNVPREGGNRLRYVHEKMAVPTMLEEAAAQGGARGVMDKLGIEDADRGFRIRGSEGPVGPDTIYRNTDGSVDQLAYPLMYRDVGVDKYTEMHGGTFEGKPLGIGIDPRFSEAEREVYYDIADKSRDRAQRMFDKYRNKFQ